MGTTGRAAWEKYYRHAGPQVETFVKKDAELYDVNNPTKVLGNITQGTTVIVPKAREYTPKPVVEYSVGRKTFKGRVKFDLLQKPGIKPRGDQIGRAHV